MTTLVASRTPGRAEEFAATFLVPTVYTKYEQLVANPDVDAVYVSTTHNFHFENTMLALEYGKHVLCEKPITINAAQLQQLAARAGEKGLFLMEAMWTGFMPGIRKLRELLAGGALLDLGVYPLNFARIVFGGAPEAVSSLAYLGPTGVDEISGYLLRFCGGRMAVLSTTCKIVQTEEASLYGKRGVIRIENFFHPTFIHVETGDDTQSYDVRYPSSGFQYEIEEATRCIREGLVESPTMPLSESLAIVRLMDDFRSEWGLRYPEER